jgi:hypothetical protein
MLSFRMFMPCQWWLQCIVFFLRGERICKQTKEHAHDGSVVVYSVLR